MRKHCPLTTSEVEVKQPRENRLDCITVMQCDAPMTRSRANGTQKEEKKATRVTVSLPTESYETVVRMAKSKKVSTAWIVRDAVEKYLTADIPLLSNLK